MDKDKTKRIYNNYRAVLKASHQHRAGLRKQHARAVIVSKYNISFAELKEIIAAGDEENGITHEHTDRYLKILEYERKADELTLKHLRDPQACYMCKAKELTKVQIDPVRRARGVFEPIVVCARCWSNLIAESFNLLY